jgi:hypothetical protein
VQADIKLQQNTELKFRLIHHLTTWKHTYGRYKTFEAKNIIVVLDNVTGTEKPTADTGTARRNPANGILHAFRIVCAETGLVADHHSIQRLICMKQDALVTVEERIKKHTKVRKQ